MQNILYLIKLKEKLPKKQQRFLFGNSSINSFEEAVQLTSIYYVIIQNADFFSPDGKNTLLPRHSSNAIINFNEQTIALVNWFKRRLIKRISEPFKNKFQYLFDKGFSFQDIIDILMLQRFYPEDDMIFRGSKKRYSLHSQKDLSFIPLLFSEIKKINQNELKHILSQLSVPMFDFFLTTISTPLLFSLFSQNMVDEIDSESTSQLFDKWEIFWSTWKDYKDFFYKNDQDQRILFSNNNILPVLERIQLDPKKKILKLGFYRKHNFCTWYTINAKNGSAIYTLENRKTCKSRYHYPLCNSENAALGDIFVKFYKNAVDNISCNEKNFHNLKCLKTCLQEKIDAVSNHFYKLLDQNKIKQAAELTDRNCISWEIFNILSKYGQTSTEMFRVTEFITYFPSLAKILHPGFLTSVVVPGKSLKKAVPYWSQCFLKQAMQCPKDYHDAYLRLMKATVNKLETKNYFDDSLLVSFLRLIDFKHPFKMQPEFKEAFLSWILNDPNSIDTDLYAFYDFIKNNKYIVSKKVSANGLAKRYDAWVEQYNKIQINLKNNRFPKPWFESEWSSNGYSIIHISSIKDLQQLAVSQQNCLNDYHYFALICSLNIQIYMVKMKNKPVATIGIKNKNGKPVLGSCVGKNNSPLDPHVSNIIARWFDRLLFRVIDKPLQIKNIKQKIVERNRTFNPYCWN